METAILVTIAVAVFIAILIVASPPFEPIKFEDVDK